jgi:putative holliday junction resolvase
MGRVLALDYGRRRIGAAISDNLGFLAHGLPTLHVRNKDHAVAEVVDLIEKQRPDHVVVGLPLNLDGSPSDMAEVVLEFVERIREVVDLSIDTLDERLTSVAAKRTMRELGLKRKGHKGTVDRLAATYLLEIYLQRQSTKGA